MPIARHFYCIFYCLILASAGMSALAAPDTALTGEALVQNTFQRIEKLRRAGLSYIEISVIGQADDFPIHLIHVAGSNPTATRAFISAGIHGDEPFAVTTAMAFLENAVNDSVIRENFDFTFVPMINPGGLGKGSRHNLLNEDINRSFRNGGKTEAAKVIQAALGKMIFDVSADLHGAEKKAQFFLIRAGGDGELEKIILHDVPPDLLLPSTSGSYPGFAPGLGDPRKYTLSSPGSATSSNEGTLKDFLAGQGTPSTYTLEYPGKLDFQQEQYWNFRILGSILSTARERKSAAPLIFFQQQSRHSHYPLQPDMAPRP